MIEIIKNSIFILKNLPKKILVFLIGMLCEINTSKIFVNCFDGNSIGDNPRYIVDELIKLDPKLCVVWLGNSMLQTNENEIRVKPNSVMACFHMATSKVWISNVRMPIYSFKRKSQIYIQTWHGPMGIKRSEGECTEVLSRRYIMQAKHDSNLIDFFLSESDEKTKFINNYCWTNGVSILKYGAPRNDIFFRNNEKLCNSIKKIYSVENKKIVMYAPTFRDDGKNNYDIDISNVLHSFEKKFGGEWIMFLKLHPRLLGMKTYSNNKNVVDVTKFYDMQQLLVVADCLITDYSSVAMDFMLMNKPVFIYAYDFDIYNRGLRIDFNDTPFLVSKNNASLCDDIINFNEKNYINELSEYVKKYNFYDKGNAANKVAEFIIQLIYKD